MALALWLFLLGLALAAVVVALRQGRRGGSAVSVRRAQQLAQLRRIQAEREIVERTQDAVQQMLNAVRHQ